jgi:hypothetical protein
MNRSFFGYKLHAPKTVLGRNEGIALVIALIISLVVMFLIISTVYFVTLSTSMSGAGKRYSTVAEAADGAVEVMKDAVNLMMAGEPVSSLPIADSMPPCLVEAVIEGTKSCTVDLVLPGADLFTAYKAGITVTRLYSMDAPGTSIDFLNKKGTAVYYRINTIVTGPAGTRAETSVLYRYAQ